MIRRIDACVSKWIEHLQPIFGSTAAARNKIRNPLDVCSCCQWFGELETGCSCCQWFGELGTGFRPALQIKESTTTDSIQATQPKWFGELIVGFVPSTAPIASSLLFSCCITSTTNEKGACPKRLQTKGSRIISILSCIIKPSYSWPTLLYDKNMYWTKSARAWISFVT